MALSLRLATLTELGTTLGLEDLHDLLEIAQVDAHNRRIMDKRAARDQ